MKYAQLLIGLLAGSALGGSVVASTGMGVKASDGLDTEAVRSIVREVIMTEPKLIIDSVQKMQMEEMRKQQESANEVLKDPEVRKQVFEDPNAASVGPKDSKKVVVEFFDYDCAACKQTFKAIDQLIAKDKEVRLIFHEYPIFGPTSETNSKLGLAVARLYPEKYYDFHKKMMEGSGRSEAKTMSIIRELGLDTTKVKAESEKKEVTDILDANRKLGEKMQIRGTPTLVIGDEIIPHGMGLEDFEQRLSLPAKVEPASENSNPDVKPEPKE